MAKTVNLLLKNIFRILCALAPNPLQRGGGGGGDQAFLDPFSLYCVPTSIALQAGGLTFFTPSEDRLDFGMYTRSYLEEKMAVAFGGRVAEELIFGYVLHLSGDMCNGQILQGSSGRLRMGRLRGAGRLFPEVCS